MAHAAIATPRFLDRLTAAARAFATGTPPAPPGLGRETAWANPRQDWSWAWLTPYNPSVLVGRYGLQVFERMAKDDQLKAALAFKKRAIVAGGWEVQPPEGADAEDPLVRLVEQELDSLPGTLEQALVDILSALDYGFSLTELVWGVRDDGQIGLDRLVTRGPHGVRFHTDAFGHLTRIVQTQGGREVDLDPDKFLVYTHEGRFGNAYGQSDLEAAYRAYWLKENLYRWFGMYLERYGVPPLFALYNPGPLSKDLREELKTIVERLQAASAGILPRAQKDDLEFWSPPHGGHTKEVFEPAFQILNRDLARALLMPGLLGLSDDAETGSLARASVHFDVFLLMVEATRTELAEVLNERVVRPLVDWNATVAEDRYPTFGFKPLTDDDRAVLLDKWSAMVAAGVVRRQVEDEVHVRALLKFPKADQTPMPRPEPAVRPGAPEAPDDPGAAPGRADDEGDADDAGRRRAAMTQARPAAFALARAKTRYERTMDFAAVTRTLDDAEGRVRAALTAAYTGQRDAVVAWVTRKARTGYTPRDVQRVTLPGRGVVKAALTAFLAETFEAGRQAVRREAPKTMALGGPGFVPKEALAVLKAKALELASTTDARLLAEVKRLLTAALEFGEPAAETIGKLRQAFEPYVGNPSVLRDDAQIEPHRLEAIVRTEATHAYARGRLVAARDPDLQGLIQGMQYSAILDERTTEVCRALDGRVFRVDDPDLDRLTPPNHVNCRSLLVPVTVGMALDEADLITATEVGRAKDLAGKGFV